MTPIGQRLLLVATLGACAFSRAPAQARPLDSLDFVVAGIPDNYPYLDIEADTIHIRKVLGPPASVRRRAAPGDSLTLWEYDGIVVELGSIARQGITLITPRIATRRGLRVGDSEQRMLALYGPPLAREDAEWIYADPRESLHVISITIREGRVAQIFVGSLWD